ncbi:MAG: acyl-CoA thioesterase [Synergistaceae bacterium]|jgi:acyl-CoA thioester hydrolase|nr:acyl-CoA thioesterase [Synergistaceae bacterium]
MDEKMRNDVGFMHVYTLRVRYSETDKMGIVYNGSYFEWFEVARTEYCRKFGKTYRGWEAQGYFLPVVEAHCHYRYPATYDDDVMLYCKAPRDHMKPSSLLFEYQIMIDCDTVLADGWTKHAFVNAEGKVYRKDNKFHEWLLAEILKLSAAQ